ncbi:MULTISPECIES: helix-turn-helix domain-containing protein [Providencia]|uniref:helix-turn-helix domain-containing protein n=3 Tax=Morganellaceae TaxID=1903414 RepID=UPI001E39042D|nr:MULTISPECIES: helix-turn-helix transcriptional regulator [Providencia]
MSDNLFSFYCGLVIKNIRKEIGFTASDLAKKMNISQQQMSRYERGVNKISIDMLINIAFNLGVSLEKLMKYTFIEIKRSNDAKAFLLKERITAVDLIYFN